MNASDFKKECEIFVTASLHESCVKPVGYGLIDSHPAIAYHWYSSTLADQNSKNWKPEEISIFLDDLISFFHYASSDLKILHCDIKPSNILINANKKPFVTDFGISKMLGKSDSMDAPHSVAGTREYMAPELQFTNIHNVKSELYSFGVTIYEFLTGEHPHFNEFPSETNLKKIAKNFKVLNKRLGKPMAHYLDYIEKCISFESAKRPESFLLNETSSFPDQYQRQVRNRALIDSICVKASYYRKEKNYVVAEKIIHDAINSYGRHPALLNALGATYLVSRSRKESIVPFEAASGILFLSGCISDSVLYLDPIINLSIQYRCERRYHDAFVVLNRAWQIFSKHEIHKFMYAEFGWMMIYEGAFLNACVFMEQCFARRSIQPFEMLCFTEAAWISGNIKKYADFILSRVIYSSKFDEIYFICAFLLSRNATRDSIERMETMLNSEIRSRIEHCEKESGLAENELQPPKNEKVVAIVIYTIDHYLTNGKYHDLILRQNQSIKT